MRRYTLTNEYKLIGDKGTITNSSSAVVHAISDELHQADEGVGIVIQPGEERYLK